MKEMLLHTNPKVMSGTEDQKLSPTEKEVFLCITVCRSVDNAYKVISCRQRKQLIVITSTVSFITRLMRNKSHFTAFFFLFKSHSKEWD